MIYIKSNVDNKVYFVTTLPENFVIKFINQQTKIETNIDVVNTISSSTETIINTTLKEGEYKYQLISDGIIYEVGLVKVYSDSLVLQSHTDNGAYIM